MVTQEAQTSRYGKEKARDGDCRWNESGGTTVERTDATFAILELTV